MLLSELIRDYVAITPIQECAIQGLCLDSRLVKNGDCFFAFPGEKFDGRNFIEAAIANGAVAIIAEPGVHLSNLPVPVVFIQGLAKHCSAIAAKFYDHPSKALSIIGITGTNGKTSCAYFLSASLTQLGYKSALMGTLGCGIYGQSLQTTGLTTADPIHVQKILAEFRDQGVKYVAMEVSSHALSQGRVEGVEFSVAIFTNLSHDHLDYHATMDDYFHAKKRLFTEFKIPFSIINADDAYGQQLLHAGTVTGQIYSYGFAQAATIFAGDSNFSARGIESALTTPWGDYHLQAPCLGHFYLSNVLAVFGGLCALGIDATKALVCIQQLPSVPGRMQTIREDEWPLVVIDYAHTPDALEKVLQTLRQNTDKKLWCVFGCGGNRDKTKRPIMGKIAQACADQVIITDDNPRLEKSENIIQEILAGIDKPQAIMIEHDRAKAISLALQMASPQDIVLIAGKGHENYQIIGENVNHFSDEETVYDIIKNHRRAK